MTSPSLLSREALYLRVWTTPITALAKEFGLTGTTLTAICRRHGIPTPRSGYWMKKEFGKPVEQPQLEDIDGMSAETDVILVAPKTIKPAVPAKPRRRPQEQSTAPTFQPSSSASIAATEGPQSAEADLHPLLVSTQTKLQSPPVGGLARSGGKGAFSVTVSPEHVDRALRVLSSLLRAVEAQGWSVSRSDKGLQLRPDGEALSFTLIEQTDRVRHKITDAERDAQSRFEIKRAAAARRGDWFGAGSPPQIPDWDFRPTGCLVLQFDPNPMAFGAASGLRRTFSENRSRRLDGQIDKIIEALAARAIAAKEIRRIHAEREAKWAEESARRKEAERRQRLEVKRQEFLERQLERHTAARQLESFLARYDRSELPDHPEAATFLEWARGRLARLEAELSPEALGLRFANAELVSDEADAPSWRTVE
jgi:hypothetical protein